MCEDYILELDYMLIINIIVIYTINILQSGYLGSGKPNQDYNNYYTGMFSLKFCVLILICRFRAIGIYKSSLQQL